jgi:hypothetical protein
MAMSEETGKLNEMEGAPLPSRRAVLALGAAAASTVVTIRPALAQTAGSVLNCEIPVPAPEAPPAPTSPPTAPSFPPAHKGAFPPAPRPITGEEAKALLNGGPTPAGLDAEASQAYTNYIRRLQAGMSGFTCYASLQMPR